MAKTKSQQALAAQEIRTILKAAFPTVKFSVKSQGYSMGDNVDVRYTDGPLREDVMDLICQYQYGHFNGMEDIYENTNSRDDIPQTKYLFVDRDYSPEVMKKAAEEINQTWGTELSVETNSYGGTHFTNDTYSENLGDYPSRRAHRLLTERNLLGAQ